MRPRRDDLSGDHRSDADAVEQRRCHLAHERGQLRLQLGGFGLAGQGSTGGGAHRHRRGELLAALRRRPTQRGARGEQLTQREGSQSVTEAVRRAGDQCMQSTDRPSAKLDSDRADAGGENGKSH
jgi:hypothetical protein